MSFRNRLAGGASIATVVMALASAAQAQIAYYAPGDWHNHTTCTDGSLSPAAMLTPPITQFGLSFLVQTDHGGNGNRDCNYSNTSYNVTTTASSTEADRQANGAFWVDTIGAGALLGDPVASTSNSTAGRVTQAMWRWQNIQQFEYPMIRAAQRALGYPNLFEGYEQIVPGHEHATMSILAGQNVRNVTAPGNAVALARWEYEYDRTDSDFSGGFTILGRRAGWNSTPDRKTAGFNSSGATVLVTPANFSTQNAGQLGHSRAVSGVAFLQANYPVNSFYTPSHVERAGAFNPAGNGGFNIEHFRDFNEAGPTVAFGFDTQPGHQAALNPGEYSNCAQAVGTPGRGIVCPPVAGGFNSVGGFAYGGTGIYGATVGGLWDAMLGEGRNFWFFGSSDFHNRGIFVPPDRRSTADFFPGEYQKTYIPVAGTATPQKTVTALRSGNTYTVQGDLVGNDFNFVATSGGSTATMGQTLVVAPGASVTVKITFTLPVRPNNSPYTFANPILASIGKTVPLNMPVVDHLDLITGNVTGIVGRGNPGNYYQAPTNSAYTVATNPSTAIAATFSAAGTNPWTVSNGRVTITYTIPSVSAPMYVRARATNIPAGTPNASDAQGNPLRDDLRANIVCSDPACPAHLSGVISGDTTLRVGYDVRSWSELWLYANPIYIRTTNDAPLRAETNWAMAAAITPPVP